MSASLPYSTMDDGTLATLLGHIAIGLSVGNEPLHGKADEGTSRRLKARLIAESRIREAAATLRAAETPLPNTDLPAIDELRVPRRAPLGGDPTRPFNGDRDPRCAGRPHP